MAPSAPGRAKGIVMKKPVLNALITCQVLAVAGLAKHVPFSHVRRFRNVSISAGDYARRVV